MNRLILFTSFPKAGGQTTITLSLIKLLRPHFGDILVIAKETPGHGTCDETLNVIQDLGIETLVIRSRWDELRFLVTCFRPSFLRRWLFADALLSMSMRHLSPVLCLLLRPRRSFYYHMIKELSAPTLRLLGFYARFFTKLVFISPATELDYRKLKPGCQATASLVQPSEISLRRTRVPGVGSSISFGFVGRLNEEKGCGVLVEFARNCVQPCALHIAGKGEYSQVFQELAEQRQLAVQVRFHGAFPATMRQAFLEKFLGLIDYLIVPSQDDREGIPTVIFEALQAGVPVVATRSGGMPVFELPGYRPSRPECVKLVERDKISETLRELAGEPAPGPAIEAACREYYERNFSDDALRERWLDVLLDRHDASARDGLRRECVADHDTI